MSKFKDINGKFLPNPITGDVGLSTDLQAINQALRNIIIESAHDRPFRSKASFGPGVYSYLFENWSPVTIAAAQEDMAAKILNFEPRILLEELIFTPDLPNNRISIEVIYRIRTTSVTTSYKFFLERA